MATNENEVMGWGDEIGNDEGGGFSILPPAVYPFRVKAFKRGRYEPKPGAKLPPCHMAVLELEVGDADHETTLTHNLHLVRKVEFKIAQFFRSIGARKHGEKIVPDWSQVVGATGRCKVKVRKWQGRDGTEKESNEIEQFLDPDGAEAPIGTQPGDPDF